MGPNRLGEWLRRVAVIGALLVAVTYPLLFLMLRARGTLRMDLLLDACLAAIVVWFFWHASRRPAADAHACRSCMGRMRRTRTPSGVRLWTCSQCGHERRRRGPRPGRGAHA